MQLIQQIVRESNLPRKGVENTIKLLNEDCTIPFISRYRKEMTGNLDEVEIGLIVKLKTAFEAFEKRKKAILKALEEQEVLTDELRLKVQNTQTLLELEDLYLPYKKKRKTKAETARKNGLEPLAKIIMGQRSENIEYIASQYLNDQVQNEDAAIEGAGFIIAEWLNENIGVRNILRRKYERTANLVTKVIKTKIDDEKAQKFKDYFKWEEPLKRSPSHRLLAILRAENEEFIRVKIEINKEEALESIERRIIKEDSTSVSYLEVFIADAYKRLLAPALSNEVLQKAKEKADEVAIQVFGKNLKQLLLGAPLGEKNTLAIDPGFRSGCKVVCLDSQGAFKYNETIYPHAPQNESGMAIKKIRSLVNAYKIEAIAIGDGTASRETEQLIKKIGFYKDIQVFVVSEAGASIYSASKIAREEFPDYDVTVRGAISIGRRLQDPLAELVKIDPKSIGVGQYQHDVDQTKLKSELDLVVSNAVNLVGVNINTASASLLASVSGIGAKLAENIVKYRKSEGSFQSRNEIKKVPRLGNKAYEQSAGFLRIKNGENPLDDSAVHPESYPLVNKMAKSVNINLQEMIGNKEVLSKLKLSEFVTDKVGLLTLTDIRKELLKPGLDPRKKAKVFEYNPNIRSIQDLKIGMILPGIINNITNFGCFVSIGIKESGLIHISNLSDTFVKDPNELVSLHEHVQVKVLEVDEGRKRIQLKLV
ncbi:MAG TPA: RNA-binding transcriptional accessory protein [Lutibacter sp.]|nr:RNA-binding transcriptional accessory protein [Lutibacter sp.]